MTNHIISHSAKLAAQVVKELPPLRERKNPFLAFVLGLAFGPLGPAIYFKSAKDFFICLGFVVVGICFFTIGVFAGWLLCAFYGAWRAHTSNENSVPPAVTASKVAAAVPMQPQGPSLAA